MQVVKVFNNNVVLGADGHGGEFVLLGRGLGFRVSPGMDIDATRVERTFVPSGVTTADRLAALVGEMPLADIELTDVERDVKVQRVRAIAGNLDVVGLLAQALHRFGQFKRKLVLLRTDKQGDLEVLPRQSRNLLRLGILKIDKNVIDSRCHGFLFHH